MRILSTPFPARASAETPSHPVLSPLEGQVDTQDMSYLYLRCHFQRRKKIVYFYNYHSLLLLLIVFPEIATTCRVPALCHALWCFIRVTWVHSIWPCKVRVRVLVSQIRNMRLINLPPRYTVSGRDQGHQKPGRPATKFHVLCTILRRSQD